MELRDDRILHLISGLARTFRTPVRVVTARWVEQPGLLLATSGRCRVHGLGQEAELVLDFGEELVGWVDLRVECQEAAEIRLAYGEDVRELDADDASELSYYRHPRDRFELGSGTHVLHSRGRRAFRFVRLAMRTVGGAAWLDSVGMWSVHHPVAERGSFHSADPVLDRSYALSANTVLRCMQRFHEDGVKRDGLLWIGDARVECLGGYLAFGDHALARRSLRMMADSQSADGSLPACSAKGGGHQHPDVIDYMPAVVDGVEGWILDNYCTDFIGMLLEYGRYSGDLETVASLMPVARRVAGYLASRFQQERDPDPRRMITDENVAERDTWWASPGTLLMQLHQAMRDMIGLSRLLGDPGPWDPYPQLAVEVRQRILEAYCGSAAEWFSDIPLDRGSGRSASWHVNAFAVLGGLVDSPAAASALLERVAADPDAPYPIAGFMKYWVLKAMMESGLTVRALDDIREYWGFMLDHGATTCWEKLDLRRPERVLGNPVVSRCHGWTCGPCILLPEYILGVRPASPGYGTVRVRPSLGDLAWAEGTLPTPHGPLFAHWENQDGLRGFICLPDAVHGEAILQDAGGREQRIPLVPGENRIGALRRQ